MSAHRAVLLVLLVVGGSLTLAVPASASADPTRSDAADASGDAAATDAGLAAVQSTDAMVQNSNDTMDWSDTAAQNDGDEAARNDSANSSLGADISSFMQSSTAEIGGAVETGMWSASFNATTDRSQRRRLVERRTDDLRTELTDLQERKAELVAGRDEGNVSEAAYKARIGQLLGRIEALRSAINATESRAREVDTNVDALTMLESDTQNLTGPEIAAIARNTSGVGNGSLPVNAGNGNGPPTDVGNGTGPSTGVGNGSDVAGGPPDDVGNGPLGDRGNGSGSDVAGPPNGTPGGPPGDVGNGNGNGAAGSPAVGNDTTGVGDTGEQPNVTTTGGHGSDGPTAGLNLTANSFAFEPISNAMSARTTLAFRALPLS